LIIELEFVVPIENIAIYCFAEFAKLVF